jgi:hybrid cluster-associated redox disulfide protein
VVTLATITKETIVGDILDIAPETAPAFLNIGMHCLGCPASRNETIEQACMVHDVNPDDLLEHINQLLTANNN